MSSSSLNAVPLMPVSRTGLVNVLFVSVSVPVTVATVKLFTVNPVVILTLAGKPIVNVPEFSPTVTSPAVPWKETVSPNDAAVELPPTLAKVILLLVNELFAIFEIVLLLALIVLFVKICVSFNVATLESIAYVTVSVPALVVMSMPVPPTSVSKSAMVSASISLCPDTLIVLNACLAPP